MGRHTSEGRTARSADSITSRLSKSGRLSTQNGGDKPHVRPGHVADLPGVLACAKTYDLTTADNGCVAVLFSMALQSGYLYVVEWHGCVIGFAFGLVLPHPIGGWPYLDWVALFVQPVFRGVAGTRLVRHILRISSTAPLDMVKLSAPNSSRLGTILHRAGYDPAEVVYLRGSRWPSHRSSCQQSPEPAQSAARRHPRHRTKD